MQFRKRRQNIFAKKAKRFSLNIQKWKKIRKNFFQGIPLVTWKAVEHTQFKFFDTKPNKISINVRKKVKYTDFSKLNVLLQMIVWTRRRQFWQPCQKDFSERLKKFASLCENDRKEFFWRKLSPQNVHSAMKNEVLKPASKKFNGCEHFPVDLRKWWKIRIFSENVRSFRCFAGYVECSYDNAADAFSQKKPTIARSLFEIDHFFP